ncbi:MAG: DedA family protein [Bacillota bacterium]|jgi:membrane protein DedA with SNARE-associated domain
MYEEIVNDGLQLLLRLPLSYPIIFLATFLEGAAVPFPGSFILALSGIMVSQGVFNLFTAIAAAISGYLLGALFPYWLGNLGGRPLVLSLTRRFKFSETKLELAQKWFNRYGFIMVAATRPFFLGNYISFIAGMAKMRLLPFLIFTAVGITPWIVFFLYVGIILGVHWQTAVKIFNHYSLIVFFAAAVLVLLFFFRKNISRFIRSLLKYAKKKTV